MNWWRLVEVVADFPAHLQRNWLRTADLRSTEARWEKSGKGKVRLQSSVYLHLPASQALQPLMLGKD